MIRGPVLPQLRNSLWSLVSSRLGRIETGLTLVLESLDCSDGELGSVEGLARDAAGGAVLVMLAVAGDSVLPARALSAGSFLQRVGDALIRAVPEANFCPGVPGRVLLVGTESAAGAIRQVCELPIVGLHACTLEPFRIGGRERFAVRWLATPAEVLPSEGVTSQDALAVPVAAGQSAAGQLTAGESVPRAVWAHSPGSSSRGACPEFVVPPQRLPLWQALLSICNRIDDAVIVHGDRFSRSISWNGNSLGEVRSVGSSLVASAATGVVGDLRDMRDVRRYGDQLLRAFVRHAELDLGNGLAPEEETHSGRSVAASATESDRFSATRPAVTRPAVTRQEVGDRWNSSDGESLRSSLAAARLSPEEYSALGDPASVAGPIAEGSVANNRS